MKKLLIGALVLFMVCALAGCSGEVLTNAKVSDTETSMEMSYDMFSGTRTKDVSLKADGRISVQVITNGGDISISITGKSGESPYTGNKLPTGEFVVNVSKEDIYTIKVDAKSHNGSYKFAW